MSDPTCILEDAALLAHRGMLQHDTDASIPAEYRILRMIRILMATNQLEVQHVCAGWAALVIDGIPTR
jgi:hypothetical protein